MIKKITIVFFCLTFLLSCGKKEDPEYKAKKDYIFNKKI